MEGGLAGPLFTNLAVVALVVFSALAPLLLLVAPAVATQLATQLGWGPSQIGTYFSVELGGLSLATLPSLLWLGRVNARHVALVAALVFAGGNLATALWMPEDFNTLLALRALTAFGGGTLMVLCMTSAGVSPNRDRVYGLWVLGQLVAGAVGLYLLPQMFDALGLRSLYAALAMLTLVAMPLIRGFDPFLGRAAQAAAGARLSGVGLGVAALSIGGVLALYLAIGGVWTFVGTAARQAGVDAAADGTLLALASLMGIAGAATASWIGDRCNRSIMMLVGYGLLVLSLVGLAQWTTVVGYGAAVFAFKFAWTFVLPFVLAAVANQDPSGRLISGLHFVIGMGLAVGPLLAGVLLERGAGLTVLFLSAAAIGAVSCVALLRVERAQ
nr:MFS transporter [Hydrogenophaga palleronii]